MKALAPVLLALLAACSFTSCETPGRTALLGAAIGGAAGHHFVRNAAIGAGVGYAVGALARPHYYDDDDYYYGPRYYREYDSGGYPVGRMSARRGFVISPFTGRLFDVRDFPHGARIRDPIAHRTFVAP